MRVTSLMHARDNLFSSRIKRIVKSLIIQCNLLILDHNAYIHFFKFLFGTNHSKINRIEDYDKNMLKWECL